MLLAVPEKNGDMKRVPTQRNRTLYISYDRQVRLGFNVQAHVFEHFRREQGWEVGGLVRPGGVLPPDVPTPHVGMRDI